MTEKQEVMITNFSLMILGSLLILWGIFSLLGGPDGRIGSIDSLKIGGGFTGAGAFLLYLRSVFMRKNKSESE
ncbi:MAG: hypothetical protein WBB19_02085 [Desulforhopalus sp.]